jgi:hypothetical protein
MNLLNPLQFANEKVRNIAGGSLQKFLFSQLFRNNFRIRTFYAR